MIDRCASTALHFVLVDIRLIEPLDTDVDRPGKLVRGAGRSACRVDSAPKPGRRPPCRRIISGKVRRRSMLSRISNKSRARDDRSASHAGRTSRGTHGIFRDAVAPRLRDRGAAATGSGPSDPGGIGEDGDTTLRCTRPFASVSSSRARARGCSRTRTVAIAPRDVPGFAQIQPVDCLDGTAQALERTFPRPRPRRVPQHVQVAARDTLDIEPQTRDTRGLGSKTLR